MGDSTEKDDGIHPLDRDYSQPVPSLAKRGWFTKSRGINLGIVGFGVGGVVLLIGIVLSQYGNTSRRFEEMAGQAHRLGMWSILIGGGSIIIAMQTRADMPRGRRRRGDGVLNYSIIAKSGKAPLGIHDWKAALEHFEQLVVSQLASDYFRPELEDVYLELDGFVVAVLCWDREQPGVIRMRLRRRDLLQVKQRCGALLEFLEATLIDDTTGEAC